MSQITLKKVKSADEGMTKIVRNPEKITSMTLNSSQIPEIKDWEIGNDYILVVKGKMKAKREPDDWELTKENDPLDIGDMIGEFDIFKVQAVPKDQQPVKETKLPSL